MRSPTRRSWAVVLATLIVGSLAAIGGAPPVTGASNGSWAVAPTPARGGATGAPQAYFYLDAPAGTVIRESVRISNLTKAPLTLELYGADAYNTERDGGFALQNIDEEQTDVGSWVELELGQLTIPPRKRADIPFTVTVPADATPGDHVGGIVALGPESEPADGGAMTVRRAVGARIYLRVAGPVNPALTVTDLDVAHDNPLLPSTSSADAEFTLGNAGNIHLMPSVEVTASGLFGHDVAAGEIAALDLLPGRQTVLSTELDGLWPVDYVTITATARTEDGVVADQTEHVVVIPWTTVVVLLLAAGGVGLWLRRRRRSRDAAVPILVDPPEVVAVGPRGGDAEPVEEPQ